MSRRKTPPSSAPKGNSNSGIIITAVIGLLGTLATAYFGYHSITRPTEIAIYATQTAEARLTSIALTTTFTPKPISTDTSTPTPDVSSILLLEDDFIDNRNGWYLQNDQNIKSTIIGGKFKYTIDCPLSYETYYCGNYIQVPNLSAKDLQFDLDAKMQKITPGAEVMIAFQFRKNASNYYNVYFRSIGKYSVNISYNNSLVKLLEYTTIPGFIPNMDTVNRYGFNAKDALLKPFFNSEELHSVEDGNINQGGLVYIAVFVSKGGSATVELDHLVATDESKK